MPQSMIPNQYRAYTTPMTWEQLDRMTPIRLDQHTFDVGQTGSGKSTMMELKIVSLTRRLNRQQVPVRNFVQLVIDTKDTPHGVDWSRGNFSFPGAVRIHRWRDFHPERGLARIWIYRPDPQGDEMDPASFRQLFDHLRQLKLVKAGQRLSEAGLLPMRIYIDELKDVVGTETSHNVYLASLADLLTQGRSTWQTLFVATQNPIYLDSDIRRQMQVKFSFYLDSVDDRDIMARQMGVRDIKLPIPDPHGFWYSNRLLEELRGRAVYFSGRIRH